MRRRLAIYIQDTIINSDKAAVGHDSKELTERTVMSVWTSEAPFPCISSSLVRRSDDIITYSRRQSLPRGQRLRPRHRKKLGQRWWSSFSKVM